VSSVARCGGWGNKLAQNPHDLSVDNKDHTGCGSLLQFAGNGPPCTIQDELISVMSPVASKLCCDEELGLADSTCNVSDRSTWAAWLNS